MTGAPYLRGLHDVRRNPLMADLGMFHKLSHMMPSLHSSAHHIVEPYDLRALPVDSFDEIQRAHGRHTRNFTDEFYDWSDGAVLRYEVRWRTSNTLGGAKTFDAQACYESATTLSAVMHAGEMPIWHVRSR